MVSLPNWPTMMHKSGRVQDAEDMFPPPVAMGCSGRQFRPFQNSTAWPPTAMQLDLLAQEIWLRPGTLTFCVLHFLPFHDTAAVPVTAMQKSVAGQETSVRSVPGGGASSLHAESVQCRSGLRRANFLNG
jgi:hypothetical protein